MAELSRIFRQLQECSDIHNIVVDASAVEESVAPILRPDIRKMTVWSGVNDADEKDASLALTCALGDFTNLTVHAAQKTNTYALGGAVSSTSIHLSEQPFTRPTYSAGSDVVAVLDTRVLDQ